MFWWQRRLCEPRRLYGRAAGERGETVIGTGYRFISTRFIRAVPIRQIALNGLKGLSVIDPQVRAEERGGTVVVRHNGKILALLDKAGP